jgi:hypothetical protein
VCGSLHFKTSLAQTGTILIPTVVAHITTIDALITTLDGHIPTIDGHFPAIVTSFVCEGIDILLAIPYGIYSD